MLTDLRSHGAIAVELFEERSLATWLTSPEHMLDMVRSAAGVGFDPGIGRNFHRFDGLGCARSSVEEPSISGEFWLTNLANATGGEDVICVFDGQGRRGTGAVAGFAGEWTEITFPSGSWSPASRRSDSRQHRREPGTARHRTTLGPATPQPDPRRHVDFLAGAFPGDDFSDLYARAYAVAGARRQA